MDCLVDETWHLKNLDNCGLVIKLPSFIEHPLEDALTMRLNFSDLKKNNLLYQ